MIQTMEGSAERIIIIRIDQCIDPSLPYHMPNQCERADSRQSMNLLSLVLHISFAHRVLED